MNRTLLIAAALLLASPAVRAADDAAADLSPNAALRYWQAFAQMPELTDDDSKRVADWATVDVTADAVVRLIDAHQPSLDSLTYGAKLDRCEWGLDLSRGFDLPLPHLSKARTLSRVACLAARRHLAQGRGDQALALLRAVARLAADTGRPPLVICQLVQVAGQTMVAQTLAAEAHRLTPDQRRTLAADLSRMLPSPTAAEGLAAERDMSIPWLRSLLDRPDDLRRVMGRFNDSGAPLQPIPDDPTAKATVAAARVVLANQIDMLEADYSQLIAVAAESPQKLAEAEKRITDTAKASGRILTGLLLPSTSAAAKRFDEFAVQVAMLRAGLLYVDGGEAVFQSIHDPAANNKPFALEANDAIIVITSAMPDREGKPMKLTVTLK